MSPSLPTSVTIAHDDLALLAEVAMLRYPLRGAESHRLERMRAVLEAASELAKRLEAHTHCALVNYRGSHGAGDPRAETEALSAALHAFGWLVSETAGEYRRALRVGAGAAPSDARSDAGTDARPGSWSGEVGMVAR